MGNRTHVLHKSEIGSHRITQTSHLAQLWNQDKFITSFLMNRNNHWLVGFSDFPTVFSLEILLVGSLTWIFAFFVIISKLIHRAHVEVDVINTVGALVVASQDRATD